MILVGDWSPKTHPVSIALNLAEGIYLSNLEGPILAPEHNLLPHPKSGPNLFSSELPNGNDLFVFSLANNHIMDYGKSGLESTVELVYRKGFKACGAGYNIRDARTPIVLEDNGVLVGIIGCCEAQVGVARQVSSGVAEFGPWIYRTIRDLHKKVETVIVTFHAAVEDSPWPSPYIRELYQSLIDAGATVVHGHHAHLPQGYEAYGDGIIFYGMGNFAVEPEMWLRYPNGMWSLAAVIDFRFKPLRWRPLTLEIRYQPCSQKIVIEQSNDEEHENHQRYIEICNRPFSTPELLDALWHEVALRSYCHHGAAYMRFSSPPRQTQRLQIRKRLSLIKGALLSTRDPLTSHPRQWDYRLWHVMFACESHRQMLATALGVLAGEIKDLRTAESGRLADKMMPWSRGVVSV